MKEIMGKKPKYLTNKQFNQQVIDELKGKIPIEQLNTIKEQEAVVLKATDRVFNRFFKEKQLNQLPNCMKEAHLVQKQKALCSSTKFEYPNIELKRD